MNPFFFYSETTQLNQPGELEAVTEIFGAQNVGSTLFGLKENSIVIPRFRAIPFGKELDTEVALHGSALINSWVQHRNIADLWHWAPRLASEGLTAPVFSSDDIPYLPEGEWFVKGETNSIKNRWFECCYAPTTAALPEVLRNNWADSYVGSQKLSIRPFQHFRQIGEGVTGQPVFNERRCFVLQDKVISYGDYWTSFPEFKVDALNEGRFTKALDTAVNLTVDEAPFRVIDMAEYPDGSWKVVELNDGTMSGLSGNLPHVVWEAVYSYIKNM